MKIEFKPYTTICTDNVDIYDISICIIDEKEKTIDCSDVNGMLVANIHYKDMQEVSYLEYGKNGMLTGNEYTLIQRGEVYDRKAE